MKRHGRLQKICAIFLSCLLMIALVGFTPAKGHAAESIVRVLLTKLQLTDRLEASLDGSYTIGGMSFQRGSDIVVSSATGRLILYYEGMAFDAGDKLVLTRHQAESGKENGLRLNDGYNLFCGDLHITVKNGLLQAVLHIPVEEYLLGVVPYEMSDSFALEALKAQAVAARTYALKKTGGSGDYDLVDNTNDQVYYGYNPANNSAEQAVKETEGICAYYNNQMAICYYTASNGGQVELIENVWGKDENGGYITMHDDPYDLENPESVVKRAEITKAATDGIIYNQELTDYLLTEISEAVQALEYGSDEIRLNGIETMSLHTPMNGGDSRVMTVLRMALKVSGAKQPTAASQDEEINLFAISTQVPEHTAQPSATPVPENVFYPLSALIEVDIPVFSVLEPMLNISINGSNNEILTIAETESSFIVEARRYGHGVGMSQRGAQWMAGHYGWPYEDILKFYYPGIKLQHVNTAATPQPPVSADYLTTPGPAATPTPRPTLMPATTALENGEWRVKVTQIGTNSSLNLRQKPNTSSDILRVLYYGQELIASERLADGWIKVKTDVIEGYVMEKFVEAIE